MTDRRILYSLGFNYDPKLIIGIVNANACYGKDSRIDEVFASLPDCPISSARPTYLIPNVPWKQFRIQVRTLRASGVAFNFLMNTAHRLDSKTRSRLNAYLKNLSDAGVERLTVANPDLCEFVKCALPQFHVTMSITYGIHSHEKLVRAEAAGADAAYLDGVHVNRDFDRLRALLKRARIECRLYANMSCLSHCPVVGKHYAMFSGTQTTATAIRNDAFFAGCSLVKLKNPIEWMQMPWIRPEDIAVYASEGIRHFKLADRLAPTRTLLRIAEAYLRKKSPPNLFRLMERDGIKYRLILDVRARSRRKQATPLWVSSKKIPADFIDHFRQDGCKSNDVRCKVCIELTQKIVKVAGNWCEELSPTFNELVPLQLRKRIKADVLNLDVSR